LTATIVGGTETVVAGKSRVVVEVLVVRDEFGVANALAGAPAVVVDGTVVVATDSLGLDAASPPLDD
jgi:hypothetical protein